MTRVDYFQDPNAPKANSLRPAVSAFIQDEHGRILMIHRTDNNKYSIPGGQQDVGETLTQPAIREVREETGYEIEVVDLIGIYSDPAHVIEYTNGEIRQEFSICFRGNLLGGKLQTSSESNEVLWVAPKTIDSLDIHPSILLRIQHATKLSKPYFS